MIRIPVSSTFIFVLLLLANAGTVSAADPLKACVRCHGEDGNSAKASTPSIAGLTRDYMVVALQAYRDGSRTCGRSKIKCKMAGKWSDEMIDASAAHFAIMPRVPPPQEFDPELAKKGRVIHETQCAGCHTGGVASDQEGGTLEAQWRDYLEYALGQYENGGRTQPDAMQSALTALDSEQRNALLHYYASGK
jgi:sulfide dehydrogenase cytochrome subunit